MGEDGTLKHILPNISKIKIDGGFWVIPRISTIIPLLIDNNSNKYNKTHEELFSDSHNR